MFYLDTSVLIAALTPEEATARVCDWLALQDEGALHVSGWTATEIASALSIKVRTGALDLDQRADVLGRYTRLAEQSLVSLAVTDANFEAAAHYCGNIALGLRAGDALHLAVSAAHGLTLATLDERLALAGPHLGVATLRL